MTSETNGPDVAELDVRGMRKPDKHPTIFATFDAMSQMALTPLRAIAERYPDVRIVGVAAQPSARLLVEPYEVALSPPFPVTYDPEETVAEGASMLGEIEGVPTFIVLDRRGMEIARRLGFTEEAQLAEMLAAAGARPQ